MINYSLVFDEVILKQLKKLGKTPKNREILSKMFDKLELIGPYAGQLIDRQLFLYEIKNKHPPIRLYFKHKDKEIHIFQFEMKTSLDKQMDTINKIRSKIRSQDLF